MDGKKLYDEKIKSLDREIRSLKTTYFKTATTINTMTKNDTVSFSLTLDNLSGNIFSTKRAIVTLTTSDASNMISACYLYNMTPSGLDDRFVQIQRLQPTSGSVRFGIAVFSLNYNDWVTLSNGGSVNLSYTIRTVGSSKFTTSITYKNIDGGTI